MWKIQIIKIMVSLVFVMLAGCDAHQADAVKTHNTLKILDIQPPVNVPLKTGQKIDVVVKLAYELESKAGTVTLAVLRSDGFGSKSLTSTFAIIHQGKGELVLKGEIMVPKTKFLQVRVPLVPQQRSDTSPPVEVRSYQVIE